LPPRSSGWQTRILTGENGVDEARAKFAEHLEHEVGNL
jgi:hypothetical protein